MKSQAAVTFELVEGTHFTPILPRLERAFEVVYGLAVCDACNEYDTLVLQQDCEPLLKKKVSRFRKKS